MAKVCYGDPFCACQGFKARPGDAWTCDNCNHSYSSHGQSSFPTQGGSGEKSVTVTHIVLVRVLMLLLVIAGSVSIAAINMLITANSC